MPSPSTPTSIRIAIVLLAAWIASGCSPEAVLPKDNVLLLSLESVRADRLGLAGYPRQLTPNIDALGRRGTYFRRAYSQGTWTRPSVASLFSGTYRDVHLADDDQTAPTVEHPQMGAMRMSRLAEDFETMAEHFRRGGYRTYGWSYNSQIWSGLGFAQGFDEYQGTETTEAQSLANLARAIGDGSRDPERPFFVYIHFMRAHYPYRPDEAFRLRVDDVPREGRLIDEENWRAINAGELSFDDRDLAYNVGLYDGAVMQADDFVGQALALLAEAGIEERTLVVLLADHGEAFLEHGRVAHGDKPWEELVRIPLILAGPGVARGRRVDSPVEAIDVLPTLAELTLKETFDAVQGRSLVPLLTPSDFEPAASDRIAFSEGYSAVSAATSTHKLIASKWGDDEALYDLSADPGERHPLERGKAKKVRERLRRAAREHLQRNAALRREIVREAPAPVVAPDEIIDGLRALGYVE